MTQEEHDAHQHQLATIRATIVAEADKLSHDYRFTSPDGFEIVDGAGLSRAVAFGRWRALVEVVEKLDRGDYFELPVRVS